MLKIVPTPEFSKQVKKLAKSYKKISEDLEFLKNELLANPNVVQTLVIIAIKIRIPNSSIPTGKSGGFRVITYCMIDDNLIRLLLIYTKTEKETVSDREIQEVIQNNKL